MRKQGNRLVASIAILLCTWIGTRFVAVHLLPTEPQQIEPPNLTKCIASGFSPWVAQGIWLSSIEFDSTPNTARTVYLLNKVLTMEPRNRFYRTNGVGILAYGETATDLSPSTDSENAVSRSMRILKNGILLTPEDAPFYNYELGKLFLLKLDDKVTAKNYFHLASEE